MYAFSILLCIFSVFLSKFDKNAIIYVFAFYKIYRNLLQHKIIKNKMYGAHKTHTNVYIALIKQLVENMLYKSQD